MNETAIDWLFNKLDFIMVKDSDLPKLKNLYEQSKEIEKKQIKKALLDGSYGNPLMTKELAEKYYYETYEKGR